MYCPCTLTNCHIVNIFVLWNVFCLVTFIGTVTSLPAFWSRFSATLWSAMFRLMLIETQSILQLLHSILRFHCISGYTFSFLLTLVRSKENVNPCESNETEKKKSWAMRHWWDTITVKRVEFAFKLTSPQKDGHYYSSDKAGKKIESRSKICKTRLY